MKARDIVSGWPRGRSTVGPRAEIRLAGELFFVLMHSSEMISQAKLEDDYHAGQQAIVNAYFEQWRLQYPNPPRSEFYEYITQMAEAFLIGD